MFEDLVWPDLGEIDFDPGDFDLKGLEPDRDTRIMRPRLDTQIFTRPVAYECAEDFVEQIDLAHPSRLYAWLSGRFIFGDVVEALVRRGVGIRRLYMASLSMSAENIDSFRTVQEMLGGALEEFDLVLSGYFYSHEKWGLVPYLYEQLDGVGRNFQVAFGGYHCKIITIEGVQGHTLTLHGSANLRSSASVEQVMCEVDDRELHDFNAGIIRGICDRFGTINHGAPWHKLHRIDRKEAWEAALAAIHREGQ